MSIHPGASTLTPQFKQITAQLLAYCSRMNHSHQVAAGWRTRTEMVMSGWLNVGLWQLRWGRGWWPWGMWGEEGDGGHEVCERWRRGTVLSCKEEEEEKCWMCGWCWTDSGWREYHAFQEPEWDTGDKHPWWGFQALGCCEAHARYLQEQELHLNIN